MPTHQPTPTIDLPLAARWIARARRATLAAQIALTVAAEAGTGIHLHSPGLVAVLVGWAAADLAQSFRLRRRLVETQALVASAAVDLVALTGILLLAGGPHSPLLFAYLAYLALLAMVLPPALAWAAAWFAMVLQAIVVLFAADVPGLGPDLDSTAHLAGHILTFDLSAAAITWVVTKLSEALRDRHAADRAAERQRELTERLAALGTLAAGVAHELGTPLGAIQLLAEEARRSPDPATLDTLLEQVARCRSMLDRLRGREESDARCALAVRTWVAEWRNASPEVVVEVSGEPDGARVLGAEQSWRAALWVALDNARQAGAKRVEVTVTADDGAVTIQVDDDGRGLGEDAARRAGEPFWSGWQGTGLGLFVSREFARGVGGDIALGPAPGGGAEARLVVPREAA